MSVRDREGTSLPAGAGIPPFWTAEVERAQAAHRACFDALYAGDPVVRTAAVCGPMFGASHGLSGTNDIDMLRRPREWVADCMADMAARTADLADAATFAPAHFEVDALGTHFVDALFGARVVFRDGQVWSEELACGLDELGMPDLEGNDVLRASLRVARLAALAGGGALLVTTPVLSCPVNVGVNLFGQRLLEALLAKPESARRAVRVIADAIVRCVRAFRSAIAPGLLRTTVASSRYMPAGYGFVDGCATQLVSADVYREFFAPLDAEILAEWPHGGMIHLCGACAQHIPTWRGMAPLRSVQLNDRATDDLELYVAGLRPDQILCVSPTAAYPPQRIRAVAAGRRLVMQWKQDAGAEAERTT